MSRCGRTRESGADGDLTRRWASFRTHFGYEERKKTMNETNLARRIVNGMAPRKRRLLAVACYRNIDDLITDERSRQALRVAELYVNGAVSRDELRDASAQAREALHDFSAPIDPQGAPIGPPTPYYTAKYNAILAVCYATADPCAWQCPWYAIRTAAEADSECALSPLAAREQRELLSCIRGISYSPPPELLGWNGGTVVKVARSIYLEKRWPDLPILADALEEGGCFESVVLDHCRRHGSHARGCWAIDGILRWKERWRMTLPERSSFWRQLREQGQREASSTEESQRSRMDIRDRRFRR